MTNLKVLHSPVRMIHFYFKVPKNPITIVIVNVARILITVAIR